MGVESKIFSFLKCNFLRCLIQKLRFVGQYTEKKTAKYDGIFGQNDLNSSVVEVKFCLPKS